MSMRPTSSFWLPLLGLAVVHCGSGSTMSNETHLPASPDAADSNVLLASDASMGDDTAPGEDGASADAAGPSDTERGDRQTGVPSEHRARATACNPTSNTDPPLPDGGGAPCSTDADCATDAGPAFFTHCLSQRCSIDECLADSDCANGGVCGCSTDNVAPYLGNACVQSNCHVDSDCGPAGYCSPSHPICGALEGFYCRSSRDTCVDPARDCGMSLTPCAYDGYLMYFICGDVRCL